MRTRLLALQLLVWMMVQSTASLLSLVLSRPLFHFVAAAYDELLPDASTEFRVKA